MIALGIDPGYAHVGVAVVGRDPLNDNRVHVLLAMTVETKPDVDSEIRWWSIGDGLERAAHGHDIKVCGIEDQHGVTIGKLKMGFTSADALRSLECVGMVRGVMHTRQIPCELFSPQQVKIAVLGSGGGHADKKDVERRVEFLFPGTLPQRKTLRSHAADAVAAAIAALKREETTVRI